jgi:HEAT repeat protein
MGPDAGNALSSLEETMRDGDAEVRVEATAALGAVGIAVRSSIPVLAAALNDAEPNVRRRAVDALIRVNARNDATAAIIEALKDKDESVAELAIKHLLSKKRLDKSHVPALTEVLKTATVPGRLAAIALLEPIGRDARSAEGALLKLVEHPSAALRLRALKAFQAIGTNRLATVLAVAQALKDSDAAVRQQAAQTLGTMGGEARAAVPDLVAALKDKETHEMAHGALIAMRKGAVAGILRALSDASDFRLRLELVKILGEIGAGAEEAVPELKTIASSDRYPTIKRAAKEAIAQIQQRKQP